MSGFSDSACRRICREYGADGAVTEFVYAGAVLRGIESAFEKIAFCESERPVGIQIFGSDQQELADAAVLLEEKFAPDFIDINFGCPAPNATSAGAGAFLLKNPPAMYLMVSSVAAVLKRTPVTVKIRTGWDLSSILLPDAARALADAGAEMITIHGRTKSMAYGGEADWKLIELTANVSPIPVIGNGSVEKRSGNQLNSSACAGFMVGRAALGNPWIFSEIKARMHGAEFSGPSPAERASLALRYAELVSNGTRSGISRENISHAKPQIMRFLREAAGFKKLRANIKNIKTLEELREMLCAYV